MPFLYKQISVSTDDTILVLLKCVFANPWQMQEMSNGESQSDNTDVVYVIFRVFKLGQRCMKMKVYANPEVRRVKEESVFKADGLSRLGRCILGYMEMLTGRTQHYKGKL